ncbi:Mad3/BUB1 homology region 1-domain-containing protein [Panaeolus papilionaceus]|nr:Mad3/BUB1 homology region 1-domain-containing protein [Panaeolus papilionaceus]
MPPRGAGETLSPAERERQRQIFKGRIATALKEEDDPLAVYDQFVKWTIKQYGERATAESGLLDLLKEATSQFEDDDAYKNDLRYLKLWALYAKQMDRRNAIKIYGRVVSSNIGTTYSALYEDYANLLEDEGRRDDAEIVYKKGIKRRARPVERLKLRYAEFQKRAPSSSTQAPAPAAPSTRSAPSVTPAPVPSTATFNSTAASRYALMLAPPAQGKRPERLRFNMSLLWTDEGGEYSIQEARARSMGLLGKKWGPPPPSESRSIASTSSSSSSLAVVDFNDDGQKSTRVRPNRKSLMGGAEPTVTINTKEALADVFGMFNSPEKTHKLALPGSKHAPLKKVEPVTPVVAPRIGFLQNQNNENAPNAKTPTAFRPFVDENAPPRTTPGAKFSIFVDPNQQKTPFTTPRPALGLKEVVPPASMQRLGSENAPQALAKPEEKAADPVFKVFTPAGKTVPLAPLRDVFTDDHGKPTPKPKASPKHERAKSHHDAMEEVSRPTPAFTPFMDENAKTPFKVFTRPPEEEQPFRAAFTPKTPSAAFAPFTDPKPPAFTPFKDPTPAFSAPTQDENAPRAKFVPKPSRLAEATPFTFTHTVQEEQEEEELEKHEEEPLHNEDLHMEDGTGHEAAEEDGYYEEDSQAEHYEMQVPLAQEHIPDDYDDGESFQQEVPLGGRFGRFNVMTPITERTLEFTTSTRGGGTPGERREDDTQRAEHKAAEAAERLAAELREEEGEEEEDLHNKPLEPLRLSADNIPSPRAPEVAVFEERTGSLSLLDTLTLGSKFRPPNPCNPFDSSILSALMTRIPTDPHFHNLRGEQIDMLADLEKVAKKGQTMSLILQGHRFMILDKLGEGGFGSVFRAKDNGVKMSESDDEDDDLDDDDDEDEESSSLVALKVVKPRQLWEYHVLRRLHSVLSPTLRRSLVLPHALYAYADESYLVLDLCPQGMLLNIVNNAVSAGVSQAGACLDELLVVFFTIELLRLLEAMHAAGFIHGDLKIDNCLLRLEEVPGGAAAWSGTYSPTGENGWSHKGLKVIDFGRTIDTRLFPPGQQFVADWATDERDCFEIRENRSWTYQSDYFGLAVEYTTEDGEKKYKLATPFKRYWQGELWTALFDMLLNPTLVQEGGQLPIVAPLAEIRKEMEKWLQNNCNRTSNTLKGLLKKVELSCYKL